MLYNLTNVKNVVLTKEKKSKLSFVFLSFVRLSQPPSCSMKSKTPLLRKAECILFTSSYASASSPCLRKQSICRSVIARAAVILPQLISSRKICLTSSSTCEIGKCVSSASYSSSNSFRRLFMVLLHFGRDSIVDCFILPFATNLSSRSTFSKYFVSSISKASFAK